MIENENTELDQYGHKANTPWTTSELAEAACLSNSRIRQLVADNELESYLRTKRLRMIPYYEGLRFLENRLE